LTDLRAESSSARLSGVNPHERGSLPRVQQEAAVVFKGVDKLQHDAVRLSGVDGVKAHSWPIHTGTMPSGSAPVVDAPLHEVLTNKDARLSAIGKIFDEPREMVAIGAHGLKEVTPTADSLIAKVKGVKRASDLPPRNPKPAQDAFESPAVDREVIYEQD